MNEQLGASESLNQLLLQRRNARDQGTILDMDVDVATTQIISALAGDKALPAEAFQTLRDKNRALANAPDGEIHDSLARQAVILEALFLHYAAQAARTKRPDHIAALVKASLNCQKALNAVLATAYRLAEAKRDGAAIDVG